MKKLIKEQILKLHSMTIKQSGGMDGYLFCESPYFYHCEITRP